MSHLFFTNYSNLKFIDKIKQALKSCKSFYFSVSFIKKAGLDYLSPDIKQALERGANGRIITSTYQNFTDIESLKIFLNWSQIYPNFRVHLDFNNFGGNGFHSKGYIFEYEENYELIVGSTNITRFALFKNVEWNMSYQTIIRDETILDALKEFKYLWGKTLDLTLDLIDKYRIQLDYVIEKWDMDYFVPTSTLIKPNKMQQKALKEIRRIRDLGQKKALIVSATGSGKTFLAALDVRNFDAKRLLFIVHRDAILSEAIQTFKKVFGAEHSYGLYTGKSKDETSDFIFATNTMMAQHLDSFLPTEFDYVVLDECHHSTASSYKKIIDYFKPDFLLGLTATPERMDQGDVYSLFDNNVPYELRLRDAILNDLVVPFHYYGIRDSLVDYKEQDRSKISREISKTVNCEFIDIQIKKHKPEEKLKAIAFCASISHAKTMSESMSEIGYKTIALTGENDLGQRIKAFNDLQNEENELEIIFTVDILNEGVDIPAINMVLFLRPTESSTVFIQQLGRGLRKYPGKEYVKVLDFIGNNYERSIQIAIALGSLGRTTYLEKSYLKSMIQTNFKALEIPGVIINIDDLSKEEILRNIERQNFNTKNYLKKDYENFKKYLGVLTYPKHMDYLNSQLAPDLIRFLKSKIDNKKNMSYYAFLSKINEENIPLFDDNERNLINKVSDLLPLVHPDEYLIINSILQGKTNFEDLVGFSSRVTQSSLKNAQSILIKKGILNSQNEFEVDVSKTDLRLYFDDLISYGLARCELEFGDFSGKFKIYGNYYKEQIMMELGQTDLMFMKGTKFNDNGETIVFVGLKKDKSKEEKHNYKDKFLASDIFQWESENNTTVTNSVGKKILNTKIVHLFVRKMDEENGIVLPFTYFGTGKFEDIRESENAGTSTLLMNIKLDQAVSQEYFFDFEIEVKDETL